MHKEIYRYAGTIKREWSNPPQEAKDAIAEMFSFDQIDDDGVRPVVLKFLAISRGWRGSIARQVKKELNTIVKKDIDN
jgi:hypothetical protein